MKNETKIINLRKGLGLNPRKEPLTAIVLKTFKGYENYTDEEAERVVLEIKTLSALIMEFQNQLAAKNTENTNQLNQAA